ncbi:MAG: hemerythrin domain-containing protein [Polyangiaceae bacterium]|nr:hemerythrin domain-containing protein [Polyangiaceae bacterium]
MDPFAKLNEDHRLIERVLRALLTFSKRLTEPGASADLTKFVAFFRRFADSAHHKAEEDLLFETLIAHGFPREMGPIAVMKHEHRLGRDLVSILDEAANQTETWTADERVAIQNAAESFADLLGNHIQKEDMVLYPMGQRRLPDDVIATLGEQIEAQRSTPEMKAELDALFANTDELLKRYL